MLHTDGTIIEAGDKATYATSTTWTPFANIVDIPSLPGMEADDVETTHLQSPDRFKEFDPGRADGGEVEFKIQFEKEEAERVYGLFRVKKGFRIIVNDATDVANRSRFKFNGYIKHISPESEAEGGIEVTITMKVSGKPEFTKGTGDPVA